MRGEPAELLGQLELAEHHREEGEGWAEVGARLGFLEHPAWPEDEQTR